jgi:hypothetical protein
MVQQSYYENACCTKPLMVQQCMLYIVIYGTTIILQQCILYTAFYGTKWQYFK